MLVTQTIQVTLPDHKPMSQLSDYSEGFDLRSMFKRQRTGSMSQALSQLTQRSRKVGGFAKRRVFRKRLGRTVRGRGTQSQLFDPTIRIVNVRRERPLRVCKTVNYNATSGVGFTSGVSPSASLVFDPSGTYGNTSTLSGPVAMPDWSSLAALYDMYRVNWIKITFHFTNTGGGTVPLFIRYNYDIDMTSPSMTTMSQLTNLTEKQFTNTAPVYSYVFKPKQASLTDNASALATEGRSIKDHEWTDVTYPVELWGCQFLTNYVLASGMTLFYEIEYDVSFKSCK